MPFLHVFQSGVLFLYGLPSLSPSYSHAIKPHTTPIILPLTQVALTGSVYSVLMVAAERYFNICKPFRQTRVGIMGMQYALWSLDVFYLRTFSVQGVDTLYSPYSSHSFTILTSLWSCKLFIKK